MEERISRELCYPGGERWARLSVGLFCVALVLGSVWVLLDDLHKPASVAVLLLIGGPVAYMAWVLIRGAHERRVSLVVDDRGLAIIPPGGAPRSVPWSDVRALHHVGCTPDPHLRLRVAPEGRRVRIYYQIDEAARVLEETAGRVRGAADAYTLPFTSRRPSLLRGMLPLLFLAGVCFAIGVSSLLHGVVGPFLVFGLMGGVLLVGGFKMRAKQPSEISVSQVGAVVVTEAARAERLGWSEVTGLRLGFSTSQPPKPVLFIEGTGGRSLAVDVGWVDPIRLFGLANRTWRARDPVTGVAHPARGSEVDARDSA